MRLYSYVKTYGGYTKSEASILFKDNKILVNNELKNFSYIIRTGDIVTIDGKEINPIPYLYYVYNKPTGLICSHDDRVDNIYKHLNLTNKVSSVGRLDKDSSGLLFLSNNGKFHHNVLSNDIEKEYEVTLKKKIDDDFLNNIVKSYHISGKDTTPFKIVKHDDYTINLILYEGFYHEVRRVVVLSGNTVIKLKRVRIGNYQLGDLQVGKMIEVKDLFSKI